MAGQEEVAFTLDTEGHLWEVRLPVLTGHADERYLFCGQVRYQALTGQVPQVFCTGELEPPALCQLQGGSVPCAFCDQDFDWQRAREKAEGQPLEREDFESPEGWQASLERREPAWA